MATSTINPALIAAAGQYGRGKVSQSIRKNAGVARGEALDDISIGGSAGLSPQDRLKGQLELAKLRQEQAKLDADLAKQGHVGEVARRKLEAEKDDAGLEALSKLLQSKSSGKALVAGKKIELQGAAFQELAKLKNSVIPVPTTTDVANASAFLQETGSTPTMSFEDGGATTDVLSPMERLAKPEDFFDKLVTKMGDIEGVDQLAFLTALEDQMPGIPLTDMLFDPEYARSVMEGMGIDETVIRGVENSIRGGSAVMAQTIRAREQLAADITVSRNDILLGVQEGMKIYGGDSDVRALTSAMGPKGAELEKLAGPGIDPLDLSGAEAALDVQGTPPSTLETMRDGLMKTQQFQAMKEQEGFKTDDAAFAYLMKQAPMVGNLRRWKAKRQEQEVSDEGSQAAQGAQGVAPALPVAPIQGGAPVVDFVAPTSVNAPIVGAAPTAPPQTNPSGQASLLRGVLNNSRTA